MANGSRSVRIVPGDNFLYTKASSGAATDEQVTTYYASNPTNWLRHGGDVLFHQSIATTNADLGLATLTQATRPTFIVNTVFDEDDGRFAPDGRWIAYVSNESGKSEVYVQPFPTTGSKWIVLGGRGHGASMASRWTRAGPPSHTTVS